VIRNKLGCILIQSHYQNPQEKFALIEANMIGADFLEILRCPLDPRQRLRLEGDRLICQRCAVVYKIKDGLPVLVAEEAELPPGCTNLDELPCQREKKP
jgi:uncharacterized protein YbaR (Trm112 family)